LARLYVDALLDKRTKSRVQSTLETLSSGSQTLEKAYEDAIKRLESQLSDDAALAREVISWIVYAERALTTTELRHALAVQLGGTSLDSDNMLDTEDIVSVCAGLVTVDKKSNIIRLVHYTAQEYFERTRGVWSPHGHLDITRTCLTYLSFDVFRSGNCSNVTEYKHRIHTYPFLEYAARYWGKHATSIQEATFDLVYATLSGESLLSSMSQVLDVSESRRWNASQRYPTTRNILHMLAYFGLHILAEKLLERCEGETNHWINQNEDKQGTCLYVAAKQGQDAMVSLLLDKGAEVNEEVGRLGSALKVAVYGGHSSTVKVLLNKGADINMNDTRGGAVSTALHLASEDDNTEMTRLLLEHGADVTIKNTYGDTPLQLAADRGSYHVMKLLLDWKPEGFLESAEEPKYTLLLWACAEGKIKAVKHFLEEARNGNFNFRQGWTPLHAASNRGHLEVVQLLLDNGADPTFRNHHGKTPLQCALSGNHLQVVALLLSKEEHLDSRGELARVAMGKASWYGSLATVKLLLEKGAEVNVTNGNGWSALNMAACNGHLAIVELLLEHGADFDIPNGHGWTPLNTAAIMGSGVEVVKLLLEKGATMSSLENHTDVDTHNRNLLHVTAQRGQLDTFLYVAKQGIDPLTKDAKGDDLLSYAASSGSLHIFEAAVSMVPISAVHVDHWSPLHWACRGGNAAIVKQLIQSGLHGHCVSSSQPEFDWSPADIAIHHGHVSMLGELPDSFRPTLGSVTEPERAPGTDRSATCDGCFKVSYF
jgi:ankyrin repeat protein